MHVVYGIPRSDAPKCILVARREGDHVPDYVHIGTGNYNPKPPASTPTSALQRPTRTSAPTSPRCSTPDRLSAPRRHRKVLVAPSNLEQGNLEEIDKTIETHDAGRPPESG